MSRERDQSISGGSSEAKPSLSREPTSNGGSFTPQPRSGRGPDPNRDYKKHFQKQKDHFSIVNADLNRRKNELSRASLKQLKLDEEICYLVEAIHEQQEKRKALLDEMKNGSTRRKSIVDEDSSDLDDLLEAIVADKNGKTASESPSSRRKSKNNIDFDSDDDLLLEIMDSAGDTGKQQSKAPLRKQNKKKPSQATAAKDITFDTDDENSPLESLLDDLDDAGEREGGKANEASSSKQQNNKRPRPSFSDTDDELLEAAGAGASLTSSKRARND